MFGKSDKGYSPLGAPGQGMETRPSLETPNPLLGIQPLFRSALQGTSLAIAPDTVPAWDTFQSAYMTGRAAGIGTECLVRWPAPTPAPAYLP